MSDQGTQVQQTIIQLTHEWMDAVAQRDRVTLERILGDDFLIAGWLPEGKLGDKQVYLADCLLPVEAEQATYSYDGWAFRTYDQIVIANCILKARAIISGNEWGGTFLTTNVWIKRDSSWQVVAVHSSPIFSLPAQVE